LGLPDEQIRDQFHLVRPDRPLNELNLEGYQELFGLIEAVRPRIVVVDACTAAMASAGLEPEKASDVANWLKRQVKIIHRVWNPAILVVDHVTKSKDERGRWAFGSQHKLAAVDGVALLAHVHEPITRAVGDKPRTGRLSV